MAKGVKPASSLRSLVHSCSRAFVLSCCRKRRQEFVSGQVLVGLRSRVCGLRSAVCCQLSVVSWSAVWGLRFAVSGQRSNLQVRILQMKIRDILVTFGQGQDLSLSIEFPHKGDGAGRPIFSEAIG